MYEDYWANKLAIYCSSKQELARFLRSARTNGQVLSFAKLFSEPAEVSSNITDWRKENWGCTQDAGRARLTIVTSYSLVYTFMTIGGPPIGWVVRISADFANCTFYHRYGDYFSKVLHATEIQNGRHLDDFFLLN